MRCFWNYRDTRTLSGVPRQEVPGHRQVQWMQTSIVRLLETHLIFTPILDCEKSTEYNWVSDQTCLWFANNFSLNIKLWIVAWPGVVEHWGDAVEPETVESVDVCPQPEVGEEVSHHLPLVVVEQPRVPQIVVASSAGMEVAGIWKHKHRLRNSRLSLRLRPMLTSLSDYQIGTFFMLLESFRDFLF